MHHWPWRAILIGAVAIILIYTASRPDPETAGLTQASTGQLIEQLGSSRDVVQRAAASRLISQGAPAVPLLIAAAEDAPEEQLRQIYLVLEDMYVSADQALADSVEDALEQLLLSPRMEVRRLAEALFQANQSRRQLRAFAKIESFSGRLGTTMTSRHMSELAFPDMVIIDAHWTGGNEGLKFVRRMPGLRTVHIGNDAPVSEDAVESLKSVATLIRRESEGCLGVELTELYDTLAVRWVVPRSPAERAGLQAGDQLLSMNQRPIREFTAFLEILHGCPPEAVVQFEIRRGSETLTVEALLGSDFGTGRCRCVEDSTEAATPDPVEDLPRGRRRRLNSLSDHFVSPPAHDVPQIGEFPKNGGPSLGGPNR